MELILIGILLILLVFSFSLVQKYRNLYQKERSSRASLATKHGLTFEQLLPFNKNFPGDPRAFRFIGDPVDGVLFGDNEVTFVEFKTGNARLNGRQSKIKEQILQKKVVWKEIRG